MSRVILLASEHPLPLYDSNTKRSGTRRVGGQVVALQHGGFSVHPHRDYRMAVAELGLEMKPYQYELNLDATEQDAVLLRDYLSQNCSHGEQVELWNLWVGDVDVRAFHLEGPLCDLDKEALEQLFERDQTCMTITISQNQLSDHEGKEK